MLLQLQVAVLDPAPLAQEEGEQQRQHGGENEANQDKPNPVHRQNRGFRAGGNVVQPAGVNANLPDQTASAHAAGNRRAVHFEVEQARRNRAGDSGSKRRGNPSARIADDVGHLQHRRAQPLTDQAAHAVLAEGHDREADHLRAAARNRRAARKPCQRERRANRRAGNRQRQRHADDDGNQNAHQQRLEVRCPLDEIADRAGSRANRGRAQKNI